MSELRRKSFTSTIGLTQVPPGPYADDMARKIRTARMKRPPKPRVPQETVATPITGPIVGILPTAYTPHAGQNYVVGASLDSYGNAGGSQYDLIDDGAIDGAKVVIVNLCNEAHLTYPTAALEKKGFTVVGLSGARSWTGAELAEQLTDAAEMWIISDSSGHLSAGAVDEIESFFHSGRGLYIWGDNEPYYVDANALLERLFGVRMFGNTPGDHVISILREGHNVGLIPGHLLSTGIQNVYEGITIAEVPTTEALRPMMYGSNGRVVTAFYDEDGCRVIADGGFTRLYHKWESAGTERYVVNAAAWLLNMERFTAPGAPELVRS